MLASSVVIAAAALSNGAQANCPAMDFSREIIDEANGVLLTETDFEALQDAPFKQFVRGVSARIRDKIQLHTNCGGASSSTDDIKLIFIRRPLEISNIFHEKILLKKEIQPNYDGCIIESPWVNLTIHRSQPFRMQAQFTWSERQFLLDQATMALREVLLSNTQAPLDQPLFEALAEDYANTVLLASSPTTTDKQAGPIEQRIPPELLWLFRHAWQSTRAPFPELARSALQKIADRSAAGYTALASIMIDRCFALSNAQEKYNSILDLKNHIPLEKLRLERLDQ